MTDAARAGRRPRGAVVDRLRIVAVADADSFVKWAGALLDSIPDADSSLAIVQTPLAVSLDQQRAALAGTRLTDDLVSRIRFEDVLPWLERTRPDVVVVSGRGPFVRLVMTRIDLLDQRPVVVSGMPGMSIPAQRGAALYRRYSDLLVVHSRRERSAFAQLAASLGLDLEIGLATLPYARRAAQRRAEGTDLVFAAQAIVPRDRADREQVAGILRAAALARPDRRVVVKLRSRREHGEQETHFERAEYTELLADRPANLMFSHEPMSAALQRAEGLVTVSSTAAVEAIAQGVPVIALDTFGVTKANLNTVFVGSGLLGDADDVIARRFRHPTESWMQHNYFHDEAESGWSARVMQLVELRRRGLLEPRPVPPPRGGALHQAWIRKSVLGAEDHTLSGALALAVGTPVVAAILATRRFRGRSGAHTWSDDASDITVTPAQYQDPIRRRSRAA